MASKLKFLLDTLWTASVSLMRMSGAIASFAFTALAASTLGAAGSGVLFVSITWAMSLSIVARWGASDLILLTLSPLASGWRRAALPAIVAHYLRRSLLRVLAIALAGICAVTIIARFGGLASLGIDPVFVLVLLVLIVVQQLLAAVAKALGKPVKATLLEFCLIPGAAVLGYFVLSGLIDHWTLRSFEALYLAGALLSVTGLLAIKGTTIAWLRSIRPGAIKSTIRRSNSFAIIEMNIFLVNWSSLLLMPFVLSSSDVGLFNAALRIASMIGVISVSVPSVFVPRLANAQRARDTAEIIRLIRSVRLVMALAGAAFFLGILLFGRFVLGQLGEQFLPAFLPLVIVSAGHCCSLALGPAGAILSLRGHEKLCRNIVIIGGIASLLASLPAILMFGLNGAAAVAALATLGSKLALRFFEEKTKPDEFRIAADIQRGLN